MLARESELNTAKAALPGLQKAADDAKTRLTPAQAAYSAADDRLQDAATALDTAKKNCNYDPLETAWNSASAAENSAKDALDSARTAQTSAGEAVKSSRRALDNAKNATDYADLKKRKDACTIKAAVDGVVTEINATVGSAQGTAPLAVIQDINNLIVNVNIKEFDIQKVKIGQEVIIQSDATGSKAIAGKLTQIAMTAKAGDSGSGVAFPGVVTVTAKDSGLRVGMSVKNQIVLSQKKDVFLVPIDAVGTDDKGNRVVYEKDGNNWKEVAVTVGDQNDYNVEISGSGLREGMEIRSSANQTEAVVPASM